MNTQNMNSPVLRPVLLVQKAQKKREATGDEQSIGLDMVSSGDVGRSKDRMVVQRVESASKPKARREFSALAYKDNTSNKKNATEQEKTISVYKNAC